jgi:hypothetical protein
MFMRGIVPNVVNIGAALLIGMGAMVVGPQLSFAGNCGGHCQAGKRCASLVNQKGIKGSEWKTEYNKCMTDAPNYK